MSRWIRYLLLFLLMFCIVEFFGFFHTYGDSMNNYMFSHAIVMGEVPYLDFNMISTPLYAFVMSLGLFLWDNYLMFVIEHSVLLTISFCLLYELYGKKSYISLFSGCLFVFFAFNSTYNFLALFFLILLLYLEEKYPEKDYLIGVVLGLTILSKQTIGVLLLLPTIIYYKDFHKVAKRFVGAFLPCFIFLLYLIYHKALYSFFNLCLFGLFDFSSENGFVLSFYLVFSVLLFIVQLILTYRRKDDIKNFYLLFSISFVIPLFDLHHFAIYLFCFSLQLLPLFGKYGDCFGKLALVLSCCVCIGTFIVFFFLLQPVFSKRLPKFEYTLSSRYDYIHTLDTYDFFEQYDSALILAYRTSATQYALSKEKKITYFHVLMYGNHGYQGSSQMIEKVKKMNDIYILVDYKAYRDNTPYNQFDKKVVKYVMKHCTKVDSWRDFGVYYKN